ncbi:MAG: HPr(Ser) kinase/phosphatase [Candidatus Kapaibacterium sp.]|nr:HPr kinase/phosphorylase [Ignavibacteriota bacterium]MCB9220628.1 HPr kinase/phosphorylase [Ignavibacteria bacterium]
MYNNLKVIRKKEVQVETLLSSPLNLQVKTGDSGLGNLITESNLHRPQLALAGFTELFTYNNVQVVGNTEVYYLRSLDLERRKKAFENIVKFDVPCIVITNGNQLHDELIEIAKDNNTALLSTDKDTTTAISILSVFLNDQFSPHVTIHGSFMDVYGVGILFTGGSGIGKSEIALDLVERGHRLVADDIVILNNNSGTALMGTGTNLVQHFMEIRGLGIIDVRRMFGIRSIRFQKRLEIIVELEVWDSNGDYTRTGLEENSTKIMGVDITTVKLPIFPGKNITVIAEVIALNYLLKTYGYNASEVFTQKLNETIMKKTKNKNFTDERIINYFQGDLE